VEDFLNCIRRGARPRADIEIGHRSTLLSHLGNIAYRTGRVLEFDPLREKFINDKEADKQLTRNYRKGYAVPDKI
jgi:hypothetical protein